MAGPPPHTLGGRRRMAKRPQRSTATENPRCKVVVRDASRIARSTFMPVAVAAGVLGRQALLEHDLRLAVLPGRAALDEGLHLPGRVQGPLPEGLAGQVADADLHPPAVAPDRARDSDDHA